MRTYEYRLFVKKEQAHLLMNLQKTKRGHFFLSTAVLLRSPTVIMGEVYLADDTRLHRKVTIKVIRTDTSLYSDADAVKEAARLFLREAQTIAQLDHMHILPLYGSGEERINGTTIMYIVMPFRHEGSLVDWLRKRRYAGLLSPRDVERIVTQAASALQHAHNHGIIHQDVKPANFLILGQKEHPVFLSSPDDDCQR